LELLKEAIANLTVQKEEHNEKRIVVDLGNSIKLAPQPDHKVPQQPACAFLILCYPIFFSQGNISL